MTRQKLYKIVIALSLAGYAWVGYNLIKASNDGVTVCPFRNVTGIPCPSCGTTEAVVHAVRGEIWEAITINPLVALASLMLVIFPIWVAIDLIRKKESFLIFFVFAEKTLKMRWVAASAILIILAVWAWNIYRYFKL